MCEFNLDSFFIIIETQQVLIKSMNIFLEITNLIRKRQTFYVLNLETEL